MYMLGHVIKLRINRPILIIWSSQIKVTLFSKIIVAEIILCFRIVIQGTSTNSYFVF